MARSTSSSDPRAGARYDRTAENERRARLVGIGAVAVLGVLVGLLGWALGPAIGWWGPLLGLVVGAALAGAAHLSADAIVLRTVGADPVAERDQPRLHNLVEGLCVATGLPAPRLLVLDDPGANALVVGRTPDRAALVVTTGLLERCSRVELEGVLARQLLLVKQRDSLLATVAATTIAGPLLLAELAERRSAALGRVASVPAAAAAPVARRLLPVVLGDHREVLADLAALDVTRYPPGLIGALEHVAARPDVAAGLGATANLWVATPVEPGPRTLYHPPPLDERLAVLREL